MGGGSSSSASSAQTNNVDKRLVTGQGSVGISADSSTVSVSVLDGGAVAKALDFAANNDAIAGKNVTQVLGLAKDLYTQSLTVLDKNAAITEKAAAGIATAYDQAKGQGADARTLSYVAMGVVAVVAVATFRK